EQVYPEIENRDEEQGRHDVRQQPAPVGGIGQLPQIRHVLLVQIVFILVRPETATRSSSAAVCSKSSRTTAELGRRIGRTPAASRPPTHSSVPGGSRDLSALISAWARRRLPR